MAAMARRALAAAAAAASQQLPSLTLYGRSFNVPTVRLQPGLRPEALYESLAARRQVAPLFFRHTPVVLDVEDVPEAELDQATLAAMVAMLRRLELVPVGISNATAAQKVWAAELLLPVMIQSSTPAPAAAAAVAAAPAAPTTDSATPATPSAPAVAATLADGSKPHFDRAFPAIGERARRARGSAAPGPATTSAAPPSPPGLPGASRVGPPRPLLAPASETLVVRRTVRAGEQVYAAGGHLVVTASVNPGAEVLADGDIHVYGSLRGRAFAGLASNPKARIFATTFDPELVAIGSVYTHLERRPAEAMPGLVVEAYLDGSEVKFRSFADGR